MAYQYDVPRGGGAGSGVPSPQSAYNKAQTTGVTIQNGQIIPNTPGPTDFSGFDGLPSSYDLTGYRGGGGSVPVNPNLPGVGGATGGGNQNSWMYANGNMGVQPNFWDGNNFVIPDIGNGPAYVPVSYPDNGALQAPQMDWTAILQQLFGGGMGIPESQAPRPVAGATMPIHRTYQRRGLLGSRN